MSVRAISFTAGDRNLKLRFDINAICEIEARFKKSAMEVFKDLGSPEGVRFTVLRDLYQIGIVGKPGLPLETVGEIMNEIGGMEEVIGLLSEAILAAFPAPEPGSAPGGNAPAATSQTG